MKKLFQAYALCWAILFVIVQLVVILLPAQVTVGNVTYVKLKGLSVATFIVIELALVLQLVCTWLAFRQNKLSGLFYRVPLIRLSYGAAIVTAVVGIVAMAVPGMPQWIPLALCTVILALYVCALLFAVAGAEAIEEREAEIMASTSHMKALTGQAEALMNLARDPETKNQLKKVYEALRFADPVSSGATAESERAIGAGLAALQTAVADGKTEEVKETAEKLLTLIRERSILTKASK